MRKQKPRATDDLVFLPLGAEFPSHVWACGELKMAGMKYAIERHGFTQMVVDVFQLHRLEGKKQLNVNVSVQIIEPRRGVRGGIRRVYFPHTRFEHSLDVAVLGHRVMSLPSFSKFTYADRVELRIADLVHDAASVALTDLIMRLDMKRLGEDENFRRVFSTDEVQSFLHEHHTKISDIDDIINARPTREALGALHTVVDRIAYVSRDAQEWLNVVTQNKVASLNAAEDALLCHLAKHPETGRLWEHMIFQDGKCLFTDADELALFLKTRLLLFKAVYFGDANQAAKCVLWPSLESLWLQGKLSPTDLRAMSDDELIERVTVEEEVKEALAVSANFDSKVKYLATKEQASCFADQLRDEGIRFIYTQRMDNVCNPSLHWLVAGKDGRSPKVFKDACKREAKELEELARFAGAYRVLWVEL